jgi:hypothetical protein
MVMIDKERHWPINPQVTDQHGDSAERGNNQRAKQ